MKIRPAQVFWLIVWVLLALASLYAGYIFYHAYTGIPAPTL